GAAEQAGRLSESWAGGQKSQRRELILIEREVPNDRVQAFQIFALGERKHVVLAESPAINGETESEAAEILVELGGLIFRHGYEHLLAVCFHGTKCGFHT